MPIYEYRCEDCGELTEAMRRLADPPLTECPKCGGVLRKMVSAPAFQFKGSGWYVTDYARKSGAPEGGGSEGEGKAKGGEGEGKGEGKRKGEGKGEGKTEGKAEGKAAGGSDAATSGGSGAESKPAKAAAGADD